MTTTTELALFPLPNSWSIARNALMDGAWSGTTGVESFATTASSWGTATLTRTATPIQAATTHAARRTEKAARAAVHPRGSLSMLRR